MSHCSLYGIRIIKSVRPSHTTISLEISILIPIILLHHLHFSNLTE